MANDMHQNFDLIYKSIKKRLNNEIEKMMTQKNQ